MLIAINRKYINSKTRVQYLNTMDDLKPNRKKNLGDSLSSNL